MSEKLTGKIWTIVFFVKLTRPCGNGKPTVIFVNCGSPSGRRQLVKSSNEVELVSSVMGLLVTTGGFT